MPRINLSPLFPPKSFQDLFNLDRIRFVYEDQVRHRGSRGLDKLTPIQFDRRAEEEFEVIRRKCLAGTYRFTPYLEVLRSKGRGKNPRVISIPTVRDRIVLALLKDYLHSRFEDCVRRTLPNTQIRDVKRYLDANDTSSLHCIRTDITDYYGSIVHETLFDSLKQVITDGQALELIRKAVVTPTVAPNSKRSSPDRRSPTRGIPQGLAISNILADIYLQPIDTQFEEFCIQSQLTTCYYARYVDDILIFVPNNAVCEALVHLVRTLHKSALKLSWRKTSVTHSAEFEFLGYRFGNGNVTARQASVDRYLDKIANLFTAFRKRNPSVTTKDSTALRKQAFVDDLNERITGAISGRKRYGWLFYFLEINDLPLLYRLDAAIESFFQRLPEFQYRAPRDLKRLVRTCFEARYSPRGGYIHDYDEYDTAEARREFLYRHGLISADQPYKMDELDAIFEDVRARRLARLEKDVAELY